MTSSYIIPFAWNIHLYDWLIVSGCCDSVQSFDIAALWIRKWGGWTAGWKQGKWNPWQSDYVFPYAPPQTVAQKKGIVFFTDSCPKPQSLAGHWCGGNSNSCVSLHRCRIWQADGEWLIVCLETLLVEALECKYVLNTALCEAIHTVMRWLCCCFVWYVLITLRMWRRFLYLMEMCVYWLFHLNALERRIQPACLASSFSLVTSQTERCESSVYIMLACICFVSSNVAHATLCVSLGGGVWNTAGDVQ